MRGEREPGEGCVCGVARCSKGLAATGGVRGCRGGVARCGSSNYPLGRAGEISTGLSPPRRRRDSRPEIDVLVAGQGGARRGRAWRGAGAGLLGLRGLGSLRPGKGWQGAVPWRCRGAGIGRDICVSIDRAGPARLGAEGAGRGGRERGTRGEERAGNERKKEKQGVRRKAGIRGHPEARRAPPRPAPAARGG